MGIQFLAITGLSKETAQAKRAKANIETYGLAMLCWLLSAGVYIAAKAVATEMPEQRYCFWGVLCAGLVLLPAVRPHWPAVVATVRKRWLALIVIGGLGLAVTQGLMYTGLNYTTAINAGLILALMPIITMILARFFLNEALGAQQIVGSVLACAGMATIIARGDLFALVRLDLNAGDLFIVAAAVCFALYTILLRKAKFDLTRLPLLVLLLIGGMISALPFYIWEIMHDERTALNTKGILAL